MSNKFLLENSPESRRMRWHSAALLAARNRENQEMGLAFVKSGGLFWGHLIAMNQNAGVYGFSSISWPSNLEDMIREDCPPQLAEFLLGRIAYHGPIGYIYNNGLFDHDKLFRTVLEVHEDGLLDLLLGWRTLKSLNVNPNLFEVLLQHIHKFDAEDLLSGPLEGPIFHTKQILALFRHFEGREEALIHVYFKGDKLDVSNTSLEKIPEAWINRMAPRCMDLRGTKIRKIPEAWLDTLEAVEANAKSMRALRGQVLQKFALKGKWSRTVVIDGLLHEVACSHWDWVKKKLEEIAPQENLLDTDDLNRYLYAKFRLALAQSEFSKAWIVMKAAIDNQIDSEKLQKWWDWERFGTGLLLDNLDRLPEFNQELRSQLPESLVQMVLPRDYRSWRIVFFHSYYAGKWANWPAMVEFCKQVLGNRLRNGISWPKILSFEGNADCTEMQKTLFRKYYFDILEAYASPHNFEMRLDLLLGAFERKAFMEGQIDLLRGFLEDLMVKAQSFVGEFNGAPIYLRFWEGNLNLARKQLSKLQAQEGA